MMNMAWTKQLSVGNAVLDFEHKRLVALIDDIAHAAKERSNLSLLRALRPFRNFMSRHHITEERLAQALDSPFGMHNAAHQNMQVELDFTENELKANNMREPIFVMEHYPQFLLDSLIRHITEEDMLMKPALQTHPYDFKPNRWQPAFVQMGANWREVVR